MIISRTPYRISFFGGGTDYPAWYMQHGGAVLAASIDKYCYLTCRYLPPFFEHKSRIVYSKIENCHEIDEIQHPAVRETLRFLGIERGVEIHHDGDLPARSGMGSSSAFTVGLLNALYALKGYMPTKHQLMMESIHIEQNMIGETVGSQDQATAAHGGLNHIQFLQNGEIAVRPVIMTADRIHELSSHLMLFYTGIKRTAADVASSYVIDIGSKERQLRSIKEMVDESLKILNCGGNLTEFGQLMHEGWLIKRSLSSSVSNSEVDQAYEAARSAGAVGGKITGAGGGGFMLLFVPPERQNAVRETLGRLIHVPFSFDFNGSQIIHFQHEENFSPAEHDRNSREINPFRERVSIRSEQINVHDN
jgi:D-glycero-alpha-D-manno-heptose-7-phosphate kinase